MPSRLRETIAGAPASAPRAPAALPPPRHISHLGNLFWWIALLLAGVSAYYAKTVVVSSQRAAPPPPGREREAFLAASFGRISEQGGEAISARTFREQLGALRSSGYNAVGLSELQRFFQEKRALPERPLLLLFDGMQRDSIEIADHALEELGLRAVAFADVGALAARNVDLVSLHRLRQLVESGRWEIGVAGCAQTGDEPDGGALSVAGLRRARTQLEEWTGTPVWALDCQRASPRKDEDGSTWRQSLSDASLRFGFVVGTARANYRDGSPFEMRRVRVAKEWAGQDLVAALRAHAPRRSRFEDDFSEPAPRPDWSVDRGDLQLEKGALRLAAREGDNGALIFLGGTERWRDAEVEVTVVRVLEGQLWVSIRSSPGAFVRLGFSGGRVVLQKSDAGGETHEIGSRALAKPSFVMRLRMIGGRATASVDGEPLLERPVEVPAAPERGPVALAVWNPRGGAAALVKSVVATPLRPRCAIVPAAPGGAVWDALRENAEDLAVLSPRYFAWRNGRGTGSRADDLALEIFAHHHRLAFLPLIEVETRSALAELSALGAAAERWARHPRFDGLNLAVGNAVALDPRWRQFIAALRGKLGGEGRQISVSVMDSDGRVPAMLEDFGGIYGLEGDRLGALGFALGPLALVGPPSG